MTIKPPDMVLEIGHSSTVASLKVPPSKSRRARTSVIRLNLSLGEGGRNGPFKAYEWNKMKTPTRILVGGPEVTSAFVLMGLSLARKAMRRAEEV